MIKKTPSAFTLIELSAVIVIIGILIAGIMGATGLVKKSKITAAQNLTKTSPIAGIQDNAIWLESSLEESFKDAETSTGDAVTTWYDQKNAVNKSTIVAVGTGPTYSNTINYIHSVKFSGSAANYLQVSDASFLNNTDYTIVVLEKRQSASAGYFIGDSTVSTANQTLLLGYTADAQISHSQGTGNAYTSSISTYSSSTDTPRIFTFVSDSVNGKKTYINGILAAQNSDTTKLSNITTLAIGKGYTGEIGEIAIFTRALKSDERKTTEDYLGKKYSTKVNRTSNASGSCINGIVTTDGCTMDCSTASVVGLSSPSIVTQGASGVTGTCGTGYVGTVTLGCSAGTLVLSASPTMCACDTGYYLLGGVCVNPKCSGGNTTMYTVAGEIIHVFTSTQTLTCSQNTNAQILVVAGGGGGSWFGGGGGGGGFVYNSSYSLTAQSYAITVGAGGAGGGSSGAGSSGGNSSFDTAIIAYGGGSGGATNVLPMAGGSGGGASRDYNMTTGGAVIAGVGGVSSGNVGGGGMGVGWDGGGGGGGAGGAGVRGFGNGSAASELGGAGGDGATNSISGTTLTYAGGGGGSNQGANNIAAGGSGGGGAGGGAASNSAAVAGTANTGGGGGAAAGGPGGGAAAGGSGIVIVRYTN
ncbi:MAG: prepilin-type N-terminal cleavage/methylation domain-containing protein [Pseudomonadota bacterium]